MNDSLFTINTVLNTAVHLSKTQWHRITTEKHPSMKERLSQVKKTLQSPAIVRQSRWDSKVSLFYRKFEKYYCCVVVKIENGTGFVITAYLTDAIKVGDTQWKK